MFTVKNAFVCDNHPHAGVACHSIITYGLVVTRYDTAYRRRIS